VAVTRAKALLIVVGDPTVLSLDPLWRIFMNFVYNHGGWTGDEITWDPAEPVDRNRSYDEQVRTEAMADMEEVAERVRIRPFTFGDTLQEED
jgi:helicase MOV-10